MAPSPVGNLKLQAYGLACNALLGRLGELRLATQKEARLDYGRCLDHFNNALQDFFANAAPKTLPQAAHILGAQIQAKVSLQRTLNEEIAGIFDRVGEEVVARGQAGWDFADDLERCHRQGRELSRRLFSGSPADTSAQFQRRCALTFQALADDEEVLARAAAPFGAAGAPLAFLGENRPAGAPGERADRILVRLKQGQSLFNYLAYPFGFFHEYSAHVHARDYGNERFNDGWMVHAAALFLRKYSETVEQELGLDSDQIHAFYDHVFPGVNPIPARACSFAQKFEWWASEEVSPGLFWKITHELAAFQPQQARGEEDFWHDQFINTLESGFLSSKRRLAGILRKAADVREIFSSLSRP